MKKKAFTLAETLIVIGIIGVVAALTLPNLNHATGDKEKVTKVKKIYSALTDAVDRAQVVYGPINEWFNEDDSCENKSKKFGQRVTEFLKIQKTCNASKGCFADAPVLDVDNNVAIENDFDCLLSFDYSCGGSYMYILADGISVAFSWTKDISIDIDGPNKGKNKDGDDRFSFRVTDEQNGTFELLPNPVSLSRTGEINPQYIYNWWVIENGNLDYLKCPDELNWDTQTSCK